jgi:hypothetical protein
MAAESGGNFKAIRGMRVEDEGYRPCGIDLWSYAFGPLHNLLLVNH